MYDTKKILQNARIKLVGHWSVTAPVVSGTALIAFGSAMVDGAPLIFGGILGILASIGILGARYVYLFGDLVKTETEKEQATFEQQRETIAATRERELDALRCKLASDTHARDELLLDDLRRIAGAFRTDRTWVQNVDVALSTQVLARVDSTFDACVEKLKRAFDLRQTASNVRGEGRKELIKTSDSMLEEIDHAIEELGKYLAAVNKLSIKRMTGITLDQNDTRDNMRELRLLLDAANCAEDMRQQLLSGASGDDRKYAEYLDAAKHP